ncbi:hypothetical protein EJB05_42110, partial [Eragrostis curvula]
MYNKSLRLPIEEMVINVQQKFDFKRGKSLHIQWRTLRRATWEAAYSKFWVNPIGKSKPRPPSKNARKHPALWRLANALTKISADKHLIWLNRLDRVRACAKHAMTRHQRTCLLGVVLLQAAVVFITGIAIAGVTAVCFWESHDYFVLFVGGMPCAFLFFAICFRLWSAAHRVDDDDDDDDEETLQQRIASHGPQGNQQRDGIQLPAIAVTIAQLDQSPAAKANGVDTGGGNGGGSGCGDECVVCLGESSSFLVHFPCRKRHEFANGGSRDLPARVPQALHRAVAARPSDVSHLQVQRASRVAG